MIPNAPNQHRLRRFTTYRIAMLPLMELNEKMMLRSTVLHTKFTFSCSVTALQWLKNIITSSTSLRHDVVASDLFLDSAPFVLPLFRPVVRTFSHTYLSCFDSGTELLQVQNYNASYILSLVRARSYWIITAIILDQWRTKLIRDILGVIASKTIANNSHCKYS